VYRLCFHIEGGQKGVRAWSSERTILHIALHILVPAAVATVFFRAAWTKSVLLMLAGLAIDVDHLLASPIYDPGRCSIGYHPLHTAVPILLYALALVHPKTRLVGLGLCIHILLDGLDCLG
jgi:Family of unknown function (DUF6122)